VGPHYYDRIDLHFKAEDRQKIINRVSKANPKEVAGIKVARTDTTDGFRYMLADNSWLLIRFSGTEPILRIYTETSKQANVQRILEAGRGLTGV